MNKFFISISILEGFEWEAKDKKKNFKLNSLFLGHNFHNYSEDFVENSRNPVVTFNKQITKSVYHDCKKIIDVKKALSLNHVIYKSPDFIFQSGFF